MSFGLTDEQLALRELAAAVARDVYAPIAAQWDADRTALPEPEVKRLAELGFLGIALPEPGQYAVGVAFMPHDPEWRTVIQKIFDELPVP